MANELSTLLAKIATDATAARDFWADPDNAAQQAGVDAEFRRALVSRDANLIGGALQRERISAGRAVANDDVNVTIVVVVA